MKLLEKSVYTARQQGTSITPRDIEVIVVWANKETVWYRLKDSAEIKNTSLERFRQIVKET